MTIQNSNASRIIGILDDDYFCHLRKLGCVRPVTIQNADASPIIRVLDDNLIFSSTFLTLHFSRDHSKRARFTDRRRSWRRLYFCSLRILRRIDQRLITQDLGASPIVSVDLDDDFISAHC